MGNIFSGSEIVEIGIQIERNGRDFYNTLKDKSENPKARDVFKYLAGEEEKHITAFKKILEDTSHYEPQGLDLEDYFAYMNALASEHVFTQPDKGAEVAKKIVNDKQAVDVAIGFEKDSIIFYVGMKKIVSPHDHKLIDELITQEQDHLRQLSDLKQSL